MKTEKILNMIVKDFIKYQEGKRARQVMVGRCQYAGTDLIGYTPEGHNAYFLFPSEFPFDINRLTSHEMNFNQFTENIPRDVLKNTATKTDRMVGKKKITYRIYATPGGDNVYIDDKLFSGFDNDIILTGTDPVSTVYVWENSPFRNAIPSGLVMPARIKED